MHPFIFCWGVSCFVPTEKSHISNVDDNNTDVTLHTVYMKHYELESISYYRNSIRRECPPVTKPDSTRKRDDLQPFLAPRDYLMSRFHRGFMCIILWQGLPGGDVGFYCSTTIIVWWILGATVGNFCSIRPGAAWKIALLTHFSS